MQKGIAARDHEVLSATHFLFPTLDPILSRIYSTRAADRSLVVVRETAALCGRPFIGGIVSLCIAATPLKAEPFIGQFELKNLESTSGSYEFQSQNAWSWGQPSRLIQDDGNDFEIDENAVARQRHALELEVGLTEFLKMRVGIEFEKERLDEIQTMAQANDFGSLELSEVGAEIVAVAVPREGDGAGLGFVAEIEGPWDQEESNSLSLGPIIEYQSGFWFAALVPMVVHSFGGDTEQGEEVDNKWDFAYAAQITRTMSDNWSIALEGYGTVERLGNSGHRSEAADTFGDFNQHRAGPILYYTYEFDSGPRPRQNASSPLANEVEGEGTELTIGFGVLEGLNSNTPDHTLKLSIEVDF
jgi:hypothetical protein